MEAFAWYQENNRSCVTLSRETAEDLNSLETGAHSVSLRAMGQTQTTAAGAGAGDVKPGWTMNWKNNCETDRVSSAAHAH